MTCAPERGSGLNPAQLRFRDLLGKVGSGEHTSSGLSEAEAEEAMNSMLQGLATDAQLGAFLIAHRIRRPEPRELCGMLRSYRSQGPVLRSPGKKALCFGAPYDGRNRSAPILPLVAVGLAAAGETVVLTGGNPMPVKWGVTNAELFAAIGLEWRTLNLQQIELLLQQKGLALCYQPMLFPAAEKLIPVRDEIGKRPPVASLELLYTPHQGEHLLISGYVHPPTETRALAAMQLAGESDLITVKGLEGSTDLPLSRACITARCRKGELQRTILHPRDHGFNGPEIGWQNIENWANQAIAALGGTGDLAPALHWNLGSWLWLLGSNKTLKGGLDQAKDLIESGKILRWLAELEQTIKELN